MDFWINISLLLNVLGFGQGVILGLILISKRYRSIPNTFLAALFFALSLIILHTVINLMNDIPNIVLYQDLTNAMGLVIAPSAYYYVFLQLRDILHRNFYLHYLPAVTYLLMTLIHQLIGFAPGTRSLIENISLFAFVVQFVTYSVIIFRMLAQKRTASDSLKWIRNVYVAIVVGWLISMAVAMSEATGRMVPDYLTLNVSLIISISFFVLGYMNLARPDVLLKGTKYRATKMSRTDSERYLEKVENYIAQEKPFLDAQLTIAGLSKMVGIRDRYISQAINENKGTTFIDYMNSLRVEEFKRRMFEPELQHLTLLGIAEECGFRSGSVFYTAFKKQTGMTPRQYKEGTMK